MSLQTKWKAAILGHAVGDALGVPVEFRPRSYLKKHPVSGMQGYGTYHLPKGTWSDDTSMTLATIDSLQHGFDARGIMDRFCAWANDAAYTPYEEVFDMGMATRQALLRYLSGQAESVQCGGAGEMDNGNGSLMRILPGIFYCKARFPGERFFLEGIKLLHSLSDLTHAHPRSEMACGIYACVASALLDCRGKESVFEGLADAKRVYEADSRFQPEMVHFERLMQPGFVNLPEAGIRSSGYVVDTLEAAIWCLLTTDSYSDCVLKAVNLGEDTDTVAAVAGGLAGVLYGLDAIPEEWLAVLAKRQWIEELCDRFSASILNGTAE